MQGCLFLAQFSAAKNTGWRLLLEQRSPLNRTQSCYCGLSCDYTAAQRGLEPPSLEPCLQKRGRRVIRTNDEKLFLVFLNLCHSITAHTEVGCDVNQFEHFIQICSLSIIYVAVTAAWRGYPDVSQAFRKAGTENIFCWISLLWNQHVSCCLLMTNSFFFIMNLTVVTNQWLLLYHRDS